VLELGVGIARGVEAIHEAVNAETGVRLDLVHRDLGARNILVGTDGRPKIIDLGLGKSVMADWQTATNMVAGSPDYMPPEQALEMATLGGAKGVGMLDRIGSIELGKEADFVVLEPHRWEMYGRTLENVLKPADPITARDANLFAVLMLAREPALTETYVRGRRLTTSAA
jgi:serine/threonine protein kinase